MIMRKEDPLHKQMIKFEIGKMNQHELRIFHMVCPGGKSHYMNAKEKVKRSIEWDF